MPAIPVKDDIKPSPIKTNFFIAIHQVMIKQQSNFISVDITMIKVEMYAKHNTYILLKGALTRLFISCHGARTRTLYDNSDANLNVPGSMIVCFCRPL
jgi:hypothetical protein